MAQIANGSGNFMAIPCRQPKHELGQSLRLILRLGLMLALRDLLQVSKVTLHERLTSAGNVGTKST
jgi:hypothetical protein